MESLGIRKKKLCKERKHSFQKAERLRPCLVGRKFSEENTFSYENQTKTNFENKENEFTIFNILYMNQKTVMCCFPYFQIKSKTWDLVDWDKTKTRDCGYFFLFFLFCLPLRFSSHQAHENTGL